VRATWEFFQTHKDEFKKKPARRRGAKPYLRAVVFILSSS